MGDNIVKKHKHIWDDNNKCSICGINKTGRKPIPDKKQSVLLLIRTSVIEAYGGMDDLKDFLYQALGIIEEKN